MGSNFHCIISSSPTSQLIADESNLATPESQTDLYPKTRSLSLYQTLLKSLKKSLQVRTRVQEAAAIALITKNYSFLRSPVNKSR